ncbi:hypothetical protein HDU79_010723 [Rhizoclosmatium sp. JEL0117]|nr:hypothetical protein HDU79_010723 [Rhizoclosmatium sp. JEL0117]
MRLSTVLIATAATGFAVYYYVLKPRWTEVEESIKARKSRKTLSKSQHLLASKGIPSISLVLEQDILSEIANLIKPITESSVLQLKLSDQSIKRKLPLVGEKQVAAASNIHVLCFQIKDVVLATMKDGFLLVRISDVRFEIEMDMKVMAGKNRATVVSADVDVLAKVRFVKSGDGKNVRTQVFDCTVDLRNFDADVHVKFGKETLSHAIDLIENVMKDEIEKVLAGTLKTSLEEGLDSCLVREWDLVGQVSRVGYTLGVEFLKDPVVGEDGIEFVLGIDAFFKVDDKPVVQEVDGVVTTTA